MTALTGLGTAEDVQALLTRAGRAAFVLATAARARGPHELSMSRLGGCTRRAAYSIAGTPVSDDPETKEGRAANLGTWDHEGYLPFFRDALAGELAALGLSMDASIEIGLSLTAAGLTIPGRADLLAEAGILLDYKTVGQYGLGHLRWAGLAYADHMIQAGGYGTAALQAGHEIRFLAVLYMDRATGEFEVIVKPFTNAIALGVIDRVSDLVRWSETPDQAPRRTLVQNERGPGLSYSCDECPWLRRCWGPTATAGVVGGQRAAPDDKGALGAALALYYEASKRGGEADRDQEYAKAVIGDAPKGYYGDSGEWSFRRGKPGERVDAAAAAAALEALGQLVPMTEVAGRVLTRPTRLLTKKMRAEIDSPDVDEAAPGS